MAIQRTQVPMYTKQTLFLYFSIFFFFEKKINKTKTNKNMLNKAKHKNQTNSKRKQKHTSYANTNKKGEREKK